MPNETTQARPPEYGGADGSARPFILTKRCPDGRVISLDMTSEAAVREHLEAMWRYTEGYSLVAVISVPSNTLQGSPEAQRKEIP